MEEHPDYDGPPFDESTIDPDPFVQFAAWLAEAEAAGLPDPNGMVLGTIDPDGSPSSRTVLLKGLHSPEGPAFELVTNAGSRKGRALALESRVTLLFPWYALHRQVIVDGLARRAADADSDRYWATRPRGSQIGAWASEQSRPIGSRADLAERVAREEARFADADAVPRPPFWGAWFVRPRAIEFWQGRPSRLHDRLVYLAGEGTWTVERRQP
ncbi:MAG: pyridoxamine 5'-phosphate oxidase [Micrococcales bacterium]|nr:pyridoxamine 5'-phosphate oxidase [Micrococcales bacterium]